MKFARIDANHEQVVSVLRAYGASVQSLAGVGHGVPDLLVGYQGYTILMEVKDGNKPPSARRLTEDQMDWHASWKGGPLAIVDSPDSAIRMLKICTANSN